jgi:hypothetical protein
LVRELGVGTGFGMKFTGSASRLAGQR